MTQLLLNHSIESVLRNNSPKKYSYAAEEHHQQTPQTTLIGKFKLIILFTTLHTSQHFIILILIRRLFSITESPISSPSLSDDDNIQRPAHQTSRRGRTAFSREQVAKLEREFAKENYISKSRRLELAAKIKLPESTIKIWFQNRRMKYKHQRIEKMWPFGGYFMQPMMQMMDPMAAAMQQNFLMASSAAALSSNTATAGPVTPLPAPTAMTMMLPYSYPPLTPPSAMSSSNSLPGHYPVPYPLNSAVYNNNRSGCSPLNICC